MLITFLNEHRLILLLTVKYCYVSITIQLNINNSFTDSRMIKQFYLNNSIWHKS